MEYDIFISYRRKDSNGVERGTFIARNIQQALHARGYKDRVFFDHADIKSEDFESKILSAIKSSKVFIFILTKDSLYRCVDEEDWVRREIIQAVESRLDIIFINPNAEFRNDDFPETLPDELNIIRRYNHITVHMDSSFERDIDAVITNEIKPILKSNFDFLFRYRTIIFLGIFVIICFLGLYVKRTRNESHNGNDISAHELFVYRAGQKCGYIDKYNNIVITSRYDEAENFSDGLAMVKLDYKYGYIDKDGKEVIPLRFDGAQSFKDGFAPVRFKSRWGHINKYGEIVTPLKYDNVGSYNEGLAQVELDGKWGFVDTAGVEIIPRKYYYAWSFCEGLASVKLNGKCGYIDKTGKEIIPLKFDAAYSFREGLASVKLNDKWGYIDKIGKEITPLKYEVVAYFFNEGLAGVKLNSKWGFIDKTGKEVIPCIYEEYSDSRFTGGLAKVRLNGETFYIDKNGNKIE